MSEEAAVANMVGLGIGIQPAPAEENGGSAVHGSRLARDVGTCVAGYRADIVEGRWLIEMRHKRKDWEAVVEPGDE
jgi:hypothetical protein